MVKLLVIGIDGATFDIILPMVKSGKLPHISKLMKEGIYVEMQSVFPPITFPAWTSFKTGKSPSKHGVFGFIGDYPYISDKSKVILSTDVKEVSFWKILSNSGYRVGIVNVPTTYPPERVNGVMISGLGTPSLSSEFVYPKELKKILIEKFDYEFDVIPVEFGEEDEFVEKITNATKKLTKVACYLLDNQKFDFFMLNYMAVDITQHFFWGFRDPKHPWYCPEKLKYSNTIEEIYGLIDTQIGKLLSKIGKANVFIVSDHGFGPAYKEVYLNEFFMKVGLLSLKNNLNSVSRITKYKAMLASTILKSKKIYTLLDRCDKLIPKQLKRKLKQLKQCLLRMSSESEMIDWGNTKVYSGGFFGRVYVNLKGREKEGIISPGEEYENIIKKVEEILREWKDPETGEKIVNEIYRKEEIYPNGKYIHLAPDLTVILKNMSYVDYPGIKNGKIFYPPRRSGDHRLNGVFIGWGPDIKRGVKLENISICDMAPTILYMFGLAVPTDMDGKVLLNIFKETSKASRKMLTFSKSEIEKIKISEKIKILKKENKI